MEARTPFERKDVNNFEFTLYLNNNIIVQRFFNISGYNEMAVRSLDFKYTIDEAVDIIKHHLKNKTLDYMSDNCELYFYDPTFDLTEFKDVLRVVIKKGSQLLTSREWDANIYPSKVRYTVNIREYIYGIINSIQGCLSERTNNLELTYLSYDLSV